MSTYLQQRYYFVQIKKDFFKDHPHDIIRNIPNGREALLLYLELLLESSGHNGKLMHDEETPMTDEDIALKFNTPIDIIQDSFRILEKHKLLTRTESGEIILLKFEKYVGSKTNAADFMATRRNEKKQKDNNVDTKGEQEVNKRVTKGNNVSNSIEYRNKSIEISPPLTPPQGGDGEGGEVKVRYSIEKIRKEALAAFLNPMDVDAFAEYVYTEALLEKDGYERIGALRQYLKAIYRTWKSKGLDNPELHQLTDTELDTAVVAANEARKGVKIDDDAKDAFWNWLVGEDFKNSKGEMVTAYNVGKLLTWWLTNVYHFEEKAAERKKQEESKPKTLYSWEYQPSSLRMEDEL